MNHLHTLGKEIILSILIILFDFYLSNGPAESRRKFNDLSSPSIAHFPLLSTHHGSTMSSPGESPQSYFSPIINEQFNGILQLKPQPTLTQQVQHPQQQSTYPKTICRHCKSHNMPECLYTCKNIVLFQFIIENLLIL